MDPDALSGSKHVELGIALPSLSMLGSGVEIRAHENIGRDSTPNRARALPESMPSRELSSSNSPS